jgi:ABC-2 type transport system ATP-binding protein
VSVLGVDPRRADRSWRNRIGLVLQEANDFGELTVREVVGHFTRFYADPLDPAEAIALTGLTEKAGARTKTLSGGQRRRLDVALGIAGRPELLFLDEPTTGFDPQARREFWQLIRDLAAGGTTILLTTHYLDEADRLASRLAIVDRGRVVAEGEPDRLKLDLDVTSLDEVYLHHAGRRYSDATRLTEGAGR